MSLIYSWGFEMVDDFINRMSQVRLTCLALPLELAIASQQAGKPTELMIISFGKKDKLCVKGLVDRVVVVLAIHFTDPSDIVIGKVFLQVPAVFRFTGYISIHVSFLRNFLMFVVLIIWTLPLRFYLARSRLRRHRKRFVRILNKVTLPLFYSPTTTNRTKKIVV